jgi:hypothetical protein
VDEFESRSSDFSSDVFRRSCKFDASLIQCALLGGAPVAPVQKRLDCVDQPHTMFAISHEANQTQGAFFRCLFQAVIYTYVPHSARYHSVIKRLVSCFPELVAKTWQGWLRLRVAPKWSLSQQHPIRSSEHLHNGIRQELDRCRRIPTT